MRPDHAKIDEDQVEGPGAAVERGSLFRAWGDKEIARMGIGVKKAFAENLVEVRIQQPVGDDGGIDTGRGDAGRRR
jgi:hypothetical protein